MSCPKVFVAPSKDEASMIGNQYRIPKYMFRGGNPLPQTTRSAMQLVSKIQRTIEHENSPKPIISRVEYHSIILRTVISKRKKLAPSTTP